MKFSFNYTEEDILNINAMLAIFTVIFITMIIIARWMGIV